MQAQKLKSLQDLGAFRQQKCAGAGCDYIFLVAPTTDPGTKFCSEGCVKSLPHKVS